MHIALYSPSWPLERSHNGIVTFTHWTRQEFRRLGHRVSVFTGRLDATGPEEGVKLVGESGLASLKSKVAWRLGLAGSRLAAGGRSIAAAIREVHRKDPIDIVEMEESFGWSAEVEALSRLPVLVKLHGPAFLSLMQEEMSVSGAAERIDAEGSSLKRARAIASPSTDTLKRTQHRYGLRPAIEELVFNPVNVDAPVRLWTLESSEPETLLFVGRFDRRKGADLMLRAFAQLLERRPGLSLVFVGPDNGVADDEGHLLHFEAWCDRFLPPAARHRIDFKGRLTNADVAELRCRARAVVVPSRWENQGYTLLEAMLQGCPVVASDIGGNPESVLHRETGLCFRSEDEHDLVAKLEALLDEPSLAARLGAGAREHVLEYHSARRIASQSLALYERVIDAASNRR